MMQKIGYSSTVTSCTTNFYLKWLENDEIMMQKLNTVSQLAVAQQILLKIIGNLE